jgi:prepilin-type processing-associated H-X9-DG protein
MNENLVGYLLKALDADGQREVENYLRDHPEAHKRLDQLRRQLDLLALDAGDGDPPSGLWVRALARVAEHKCRTLPAVPPAAAQTAPAARATWWRRADVLVAAVLLVLLGGLGVIGVAHLRQGSGHVVECARNLERFHRALTDYADNHHGQFPAVGAEPPRNFAGSFVVTLHESGVMPPGLSVSCPGEPPRAPMAITFAELEKLSPDEFQNMTRTLAGCYAYSLGYREPGGTGLLGLTQSMDGRLPIMADAPAMDAPNEVRQGNSTNHEGKGQNVLFLDGHVEFLTTRSVGSDDDIYLNADRRVEAGRGPRDTVLGRSDARP